MNRINKVIRSVRATSIFALALLPILVFAQSQNQMLGNPSNTPNIQTFIANFLKAIVEISLPILTLYIVYAGFKFVVARGNEHKLEEAKRNFLYVVLGAILILGAWVLATLISATATQVLGQPAGI